MSSFVHLHVHSEYSLRQSTLRIDDLIRQASDMQMGAVALTDTNALYGAIPFYRKARKAGLKPILGVQLAVSKAPTDVARRLPASEPLDQAVLLAEDLEGYQNLVRLVTLLQSRQRLPYVTFAELAACSARTIALIGGGESWPVQLLSEGRKDEAIAWLDQWLNVWPKASLFVDLHDHGIPAQRRALPGIISWARANEVPLVATNDVHYLTVEDAEIQRVLAGLDGGARPRMLEGDQYGFLTPADMIRKFASFPDAIANTVTIAKRCNVELPEGQTLLPSYPTSSGESAAVVLRRAAEEGLRRRFDPVPDAVRQRLEYELGIIERLGFSDYFLVVADFIRFAHKQGISTGPGRGSSAGSLVSYALRITDVDPVRHKLLFERFLNPERVTWPDIDVDFEFERRSEVIAYVMKRYGTDHVAQIGTFGTLAARAAVRDVGRVLHTDPKLVDRLAKAIPSYPGVTLEQAEAELPVANLLAANPNAAHLWTIAKRLEGLPRHTSTHAAGVVISPVPLARLVPVQPGADGVPITQFPMEDVEFLGLMKMDFLGLRTLTLIDMCVASVEARRGHRIDWRRVPTDDGRTFEMLSRGETDGCFQLESKGVRRVLRDLRPTDLEDLIAVISLYRPGPMESIPTFIASKHGRQAVQYPHPHLEPVLKDTYGVIVYQEQIMQIAAVMAGFSLGQADLLRRAVSKKKREVLDAERSRFVEGSLRRGYSEEAANDVYDLIVRFADYGFPRSHAAAYAVLAFRTAWLRAHHLPEFLASLMSMSIGSEDKLREYERDARQHGIQVLPPSVQESARVYTVEGERAIRTGLLAVRNVGRAAVDAMMTSRSEAPFHSLVDFLRRVSARVCNRKSVESLLSAGALSAFLPDAASPQVAAQILNEAYVSAGEQNPSTGLGLDFGGHRSSREEEVDVLYVRFADHEQDILGRIQRAAEHSRGSVRIALYDEDRRKLRVLEETWSVSVTPDLIAELEDVAGLGNVRLGKMPLEKARRRIPRD